MWFSKVKYFSNKQIRITFVAVSVLTKVTYFTEDLLQVSNHKIRETAATSGTNLSEVKYNKHDQVIFHQPLSFFPLIVLVRGLDNMFTNAFHDL